MTTHTHHSHPQDRPHRHHYDAEMLSVEEARERILSYFDSLSTVDVPLLDSLGLTVAEDLVAGIRHSSVGQLRDGWLRSPYFRYRRRIQIQTGIAASERLHRSWRRALSILSPTAPR